MKYEINFKTNRYFKSINYINLCCGIGGFRIALENWNKKLSSTFICVLFTDIKDDDTKTYNLNLNGNNGGFRIA